MESKTDGWMSLNEYLWMKSFKWDGSKRIRRGGNKKITFSVQLSFGFKNWKKLWVSGHLRTFYFSYKLHFLVIYYLFEILIF